MSAILKLNACQFNLDGLSTPVSLRLLSSAFVDTELVLEFIIEDDVKE